MGVLPDTRALDRAADWRLINYGRGFIQNDGYANYNDSPAYSSDPRYVDLVRVFDNIDTLFFDVDFFTDTSLDCLPGRTAAMLRVDRFARWFPKESPEDSLYQKRLLLTIREYKDSVATHDPGLEKLRIKFLAHDTLHFPLFGHPFCGLLLYNRQSWYTAYPGGIFELQEDLMQQERQKQSRLGFSEQDRWPRDPPGHDHTFEDAIRTHLMRNWAGELTLTVRRPIGYRDGCDGDCEKLDVYDCVEDFDCLSSCTEHNYI